VLDFGDDVAAAHFFPVLRHPYTPDKRASLASALYDAEVIGGGVGVDSDIATKA
jgi:hypothetical protein